MMWLFGIVAVGVIGFTAALASGRLGEMPALRDDHPVPRLPEGDFDADSLAAVRFATTTRGYHRPEVDALLKRAGVNLAAHADGTSVAPSEQMDADTIRDATFDITTGGYLMSQVDAVLERLARQFDAWPPVGDHVAVAQSSDPDGSDPAQDKSDSVSSDPDSSDSVSSDPDSPDPDSPDSVSSDPDSPDPVSSDPDLSDPVAAESVSSGEYLGQRRGQQGDASVQSGLDAE